MTTDNGHSTEFMTFRVKAGMEALADEWMRVLQQRRDECIATLDRERMHYECIFRSERDGRLYLSWFSVQGRGGEPVRGSPHPIDRMHLDYWDRCIDRDAAPEKMEHVASFVPPLVAWAVRSRDRW